MKKKFLAHGIEIFVLALGFAACGEDGKNGVDGAPGEQGAAGESCTARSVETGVEISCGGVVVDTLTNGVSSMGDTGPGCSIGDPSTDMEGNTVVTVTCGETSKTLTVAKGDKGETGAGCTVGDPSTDKEGNTVVTVTCGETSETLTVAKGGKGETGAGCTVGESSTDMDGNTVVTVTCGESKETLTIAKGNPGEAGVGCKAEDKGDGKVVVTCGEGESKTEQTLFKAVCGSINFEPANAFCLEGKIYSCDNKPYNPAEQYCLSVTDEEGAEKKTVEELLIDNRDMDNVQIYKTVKICDDNNENCQTWMAQNLNYYPGDVSGMGSKAWSGCYERNDENCSKYGRLYTWEVAMNKADCGYGTSCNNKNEGAQGVCPEGWHLPSKAEWTTLFDNVGGKSAAGQKLTSTSGWEDGNGTDSFGFTVLPAGVRLDQDYVEFSGGAHFWSSTESDINQATRMVFRNAHVIETNPYKSFAVSVRCLKD